jgi:hypothetical protein
VVRNEAVVVAFAASPSDVEDERNKLEEVVRELNLTWSRTLQARLELIRWETHAYPGVGRDAQDVINQQLRDDYDIFIGIMWGKFGSPTERAGSGTEEEFRRAWRRHEAKDDVQIMFYFKDTPIAPSKTDPSQLARVQSFKSELGDGGVLHWTFNTVEQFEGLLRMHLARQMQSRPSAAAAGSRQKPAARSADDDDQRATEEEPGILDLMEVFEERFETVNEIVTRIGAETSDLGERMSTRTIDITTARAEAAGDLSRSDAKKLVNKAADDMNRYVTRAGAEIPILWEALREGIQALGKAATLSVDLDQGDLSKVKEGRAAVTTLETALDGAHESMLGFRHTVHSLPRMTTMLIKAKRSTLEILDELLQGLEDGKRDATEAGKVLDAILSGQGDA